MRKAWNLRADTVNGFLGPTAEMFQAVPAICAVIGALASTVSNNRKAQVAPVQPQQCVQLVPMQDSSGRVVYVPAHYLG